MSHFYMKEYSGKVKKIRITLKSFEMKPHKTVVNHNIRQIVHIIFVHTHDYHLKHIKKYIIILTNI